MTDAMSKALDELMGKHRNAIEPEAKKQQLQFDDPDVCKHELAGLCPYTLFNNTKSDLGALSACPDDKPPVALPKPNGAGRLTILSALSCRQLRL